MFLRAVVMVGCVTGCGRISFEPLASDGATSADSIPKTIGWRSTSATMIPNTTGALSVTLVPGGFEAGEMMIAVIAMGNSSNSAAPAFTPPNGWTLVQRLDQSTNSTLAVYWHAATASEPTTYTWSFDQLIEGVAWISRYTGVDVIAPIDTNAGQVITNAGPAYSAPSITTGSPNELVLATFVAHTVTGTPTLWTAPAGTQPRANLNNANSRSGLGVELKVATADPIGTLIATASLAQDYALVEVLALRPGP